MDLRSRGIVVVRLDFAYPVILGPGIISLGGGTLRALQVRGFVSFARPQIARNRNEGDLLQFV